MINKVVICQDCRDCHDIALIGNLGIIQQIKHQQQSKWVIITNFIPINKTASLFLFLRLTRFKRFHFKAIKYAIQ